MFCRAVGLVLLLCGFCAAADPIAPRRPELPVGPESTESNPIDRLLQPYFREHDITPSSPVADRIFARRVFLDLVGLLPVPEQLDAFLKDNRRDKRERLVQKLLADNAAYADHWLTFWNDALRNAYRGTGFIDNGRTQLTDWLYPALYENKPYDRFVHELISPVPGSEGFTKGIVWRGVVNASQRPEVQAAQNLSQVFLGINLKCASCHDSFISDWKLADVYALGSVFAAQPLEIYHCDKPTGETSGVGFLYPQLGKVDAQAPREERMRQLADVVTSPQNGRLTRTIVNRLWAHFLGRGLVEPVDEMDNPPWSRDLLDWLASDLAEHGYDLKHTMRVICTSKAYQSPAVGAADKGDGEFTFRGPLVKRMSAEQFVDALSIATGVSKQATPALLRKDGRGQGGQLAAVARVTKTAPESSLPTFDGAKWIWSDPQAARGASGGRIFLRKTFHLDRRPQETITLVTCDNEFTLLVNGKRAATGAEWNNPVVLELNRWLVKGKNTIAVEAINWPDPATKKGLNNSSPNPAGFLFFAVGRNDKRPAWTLGSDASWIWSTEVKADWEKPDFDTAGWQHSHEIGDVDAGPWNIRDRLAAATGVAEQPVRAALAFSDPLMTALGRPNREQVVTHRDSQATTLQMLELTNGSTLDGILKDGAAQWLDREAKPSQLIDGIYAGALGRAPTPAERQTALKLIGTPPTAEGVEDLLWALIMLPEFQLIY